MGIMYELHVNDDVCVHNMVRSLCFYYLLRTEASARFDLGHRPSGNLTFLTIQGQKPRLDSIPVTNQVEALYFCNHLRTEASTSFNPDRRLGENLTFLIT